jgi:hypothetical protein
MFMVNHYMAHPFQRIYWIHQRRGLWTLAVLYIRVLRPIQLLRSALPGRFGTAGAGRGLDTLPGARWPPRLSFHGRPICLADSRTSPFSFRDNPFSFSSSAENKHRIEFTIKEAGDFTAMIKELQAGERVYVDSCYGTFDIDQHDAPGYVMIAGGIGSVPFSASCARWLIERTNGR